MKIGCETRPFIGMEFCGDQCGWWHHGNRIVLALADGLGHGEEAEFAAKTAINRIEANLALDVESLFAICDATMRNTRGAALAIAIIDKTKNHLTVASVGNVRIVLLRNGKDRRFGGARGIVGAGYTNLAPDHLPLEANNVLVMFSDGLDELATLRETISHSMPTAYRHAGDILRCWARADDDAAVLIYQHDNEPH